MTSQKKKVLFFLPNTVGGAERMTIIIAKMLPRHEFEVKFIVVGRSVGSIIEFIPSDYPVRLIHVKSIWLGGTIKIWNFIRKEKPNIVFSSMIYLNARLILAAKLCGIKVIVRNNTTLKRTTQQINKLLILLTYRWANIVIAQQEEMRDEIISFTRLPAEKVITLHNPIDVEHIKECLKAENPFPREAQSQYKYICIARFNPVKGQDLIVRAIEMVHRERPNAHLYLIGKYDENSSYFKSIKEFVESHKLRECVHFMGYDSNPYRWMKYAECFVMPSRLEGLPNSLIDAMYIGKPVVATRCIPVIDRIVENGYNGIVVDSDNVMALAEGMRNAPLLNDFEMTYHPSSNNNFISIFNSI